MRSAVRIGSALVAGGLAGLTVAADQSYVNPDYRYRVDLPLGVAAERNDPPSPYHGFIAHSQHLGDALV